MLPGERLPYSTVSRRPPIRLPDGVKLVLWQVLALEHWDINRPMARMVISPPQGQAQQPDHPKAPYSCTNFRQRWPLIWNARPSIWPPSRRAEPIHAPTSLPPVTSATKCAIGW